MGGRRDGFWVMKSDSSGTTTYLRSGTSVVAPVVADSGAVYTPGISERRGSASRFYHGDIKNFVEQTDSSGQIVSSQQYDAFGNPVSSTGTWSGPFAYGGRFGYQFDSDTSLSLLGHRYYDPTTGRFLTRDPIGDGRNWYGYCGNNPVTFADPLGLWKAVIILGPHKWYESLVIGIAIAKFKRWLRKKGATKIVIVRQPTEAEVRQILSDDEVKGFVMIGHGPEEDDEGAYVTFEGGAAEFDATSIRLIAKHRKAKMKCALVFACRSDRLGDDLLSIAEEVIVYSGAVGYFDLWYIPKPHKPPTQKPPTRIGGGAANLARGSGGTLGGVMGSDQ